MEARKLSARQRIALELIKANPEAMSWPGRFAEAFWPDIHKREMGDGTVYKHIRRNKRNTPTYFWLGGGYLGRLRKAGLITGGMYDFGGPGRQYRGREPLYLTKLAQTLLVKAQADEAAKRPQTYGHAEEERLQFGR